MNIGDICEKGLWLEVYCLPCARTVHFPAEMIPDKLPRNIAASQAAKHFKCSKCGSKNLVSRPHWPNLVPGRGRGRR